MDEGTVVTMDDGEWFYEAAREKIDQHGWVVTNSVHIDEQRRALSWCYTIGLTQYGLPELVIAGLDVATAHKILNLAGLRSRERRPQIGERCVLERFNPQLRFTFAPVHPMWGAYKMIRVRRTYPQWEPTEAGVLQMLYPDASGCFPGNPFYAIDPHTQPLLCDSDENFTVPATFRVGPWTYGVISAIEAKRWVSDDPYAGMKPDARKADTPTGDGSLVICDDPHPDMETPPQ